MYRTAGLEQGEWPRVDFGGLRRKSANIRYHFSTIIKSTFPTGDTSCCRFWKVVGDGHGSNPSVEPLSGTTYMRKRPSGLTGH